MTTAKTAMVAKLRQEIAGLQGNKPGWSAAARDVLPAVINKSFPDQQFQIAGVHEFFYVNHETAAATNGFTAAMLATLMKNGGVCIWITKKMTLFPPSLQLFGVKPEKIVFIEAAKEKEILWVMEEALKCASLAAVIGELKGLSFMCSRRLQLAVEKSKVPCFVFRDRTAHMNTTACITRWCISPCSSYFANEMPGVGFPRWNVELKKVRNGTPGSWTIEFSGGRLRQVFTGIYQSRLLEPQQKTG